MQHKEISLLPHSELELMLIIWDAEGPVTRTDIEEKLEGKNWGPTTVLKFLSRLVERGFVACESQGPRQKNLYTALITEEEYLAAESRSVVGKLCGRSVRNLVACLCDNQEIDAADLDELSAFIEKRRKEL